VIYLTDGTHHSGLQRGTVQVLLLRCVLERARGAVDLIKCIVAADSKWTELGVATTGVPPKAVATLRDGGICATPELPLMDVQDLVYNKQRLKQIPEPVAERRHAYIRRRNWGLKPAWMLAASDTEADETPTHQLIASVRR
jgi:hypothetical protein